MKKTPLDLKKVNRGAPLPIYHQIKDIIREKIRTGDWKPGGMIPSEPELSKYFQISKMTVRQAISALSDEGLLIRIRGKGTFVAKPKIQRDLSYLTYFTEQIRESGFVIETKLQRSEIVEASQEIAEKLEIKKGEPVIKLQRLREIEGSPFYIETCYFPHSSCQLLLDQDLSQHSIHYFIENQLGFSIDYAVMEIEAIAASPKQSLQLNVKKGTALLLIKQITFLSNGRPIQLVEAVSRSDKFKYSLTRRKKR